MLLLLSFPGSGMSGQGEDGEGVEEDPEATGVAPQVGGTSIAHVPGGVQRK